jgi:hypothetical protein
MIDSPESRLAGSWTVTFANGVYQWSDIGSDRTVSVLESRRRSAGRVELRDGFTLVVYDDDRLERWTRVAHKAVVEHWYPATAYPAKAPVVGVAVARHRPEPGEATLPDPTGRELKAAATTKMFAAALRRQLSDDTAGELRKYIDPRYLKQHGLEHGSFPIRRIVTGSIYDNSVVDERMIFMVVETEEAEKEAWLFRVAKYQGEMYIVPSSPPDPTTKSFTAWTFRRKL